MVTTDQQKLQSELETFDNRRELFDQLSKKRLVHCFIVSSGLVTETQIKTHNCNFVLIYNTI